MSDLTAPRPYKDRTVGLILFGILEIGIALLCLLVFGLMLVAVAASSAVPAPAGAAMGGRSLFAAAVFYLLIAGVFGTLGVGTLRGRRWARTLMLVLSWLWLLCGLLGAGSMFFFLPKLLAGLPSGGASDESAKMFVSGCMMVGLGLLYVVLPTLFVLFYRGPNVRATFEAKDPNVPWTDRTPAPVLAVSLMLGYGAVGSLAGLAFGAIPFFGTLLTGAPAIVACLALGALCAYLARGTYLRQPAAWWGLLALAILGLISTALMITGHPNLRELYQAMGLATPEMERMGIYDLWQQPALIVLTGVTGLAWIGFLVWLRKYFRRSSGADREIYS